MSKKEVKERIVELIKFEEERIQRRTIELLPNEALFYLSDYVRKHKPEVIEVSKLPEHIRKQIDTAKTKAENEQ